MANRLQKQAVYRYTPAVAAVQGREAYCESRQVFVGYQDVPSPPPQFVPIGSVPNGGYSLPAGAQLVYTQQYNPVTGGYDRVLSGYLIGAPYGTSSRVPRYETVQVCYEAVEAVAAVPGRMDITNNYAWNAGARSIAEVPAGHYAEVQIPQTVTGGLMFGLSDGEFDHSYYHPTHALVARPGGITPVESGADVGAQVGLGQLLRIVRTQTSVLMYVDGVLVKESDTPIVGKAYADATLYALADFFDNPKIGSYVELSGVTTASVQTAYADGLSGSADVRVVSIGIIAVDGVVQLAGTTSVAVKTRLQGIQDEQRLAGTAVITAESVVTGFVASGGGAPNQVVGAMAAVGMAYARGKAVMRTDGLSQPMFSVGIIPVPTVKGLVGQPEATPIQAGGIAGMPLLITSLSTNSLIQAQGTAAAPKGKAVMEGFSYMGATGKAPPPTVVSWFSYLPDTEMDASQMVVLASYLSMESIILFAMTDSVGLTDEISMYALVPLEIFERVGLDSSMSFLSLVQMAIEERISLTTDIHSAAREALQYAVNSQSYAITRYQGMGFTRFARAGGKTYAINDKGLCLLQPGTDDGDLINAMIDFGGSDYGSSESKRLGYIYAGIGTDGGVYFRVTPEDGEELIYKATQKGVESRAKPGMGASARHWRLRLEIADASYVRVDNVEVQLGVTQRRLRR